MTDYQRILSYLYRYEKAEKKECPGFVKAEQRAGILKLTIQIDDERLLQGMELKLCFYEKQGEQWQVWQLDTVITQEHKEEIHLTYPAEKLPEGFHIKGQSGVLLYYQDNFYYGSVWIGDEIPAEALETLRWHKMQVSEETEQDVAKNIKEDIENQITKTASEFSKEKKQKDEVPGEKPMIKENEISEENAQKENLVALDESVPDVIQEDLRQEGLDKEEVPENILKDNIQKEKSTVDSIVTGVEKREADIKKDEDTESEIEYEDTEESVQIKENLVIRSDEDSQINTKGASNVDNSKKLWINFVKEKPSVDNIFNTAFYEGYRIEPADLKRMGEEAEMLQGNQFLLKGYERYKHLLAGKVRYAGEERYCIGVPGIYENREKYMADIYQFPIFLSLTENRMKTGSFGYWLYLLDMYL